MTRLISVYEYAPCSLPVDVLCLQEGGLEYALCKLKTEEARGFLFGMERGRQKREKQIGGIEQREAKCYFGFTNLSVTISNLSLQ